MMAAAATATATTTTTTTTCTSNITHLKKSYTQQNPIKPRRRRNPTRKLDPPTIVSSDNSWCCFAAKDSKPVSSQPRPEKPINGNHQPDSIQTHPAELSPSSSPSAFRIRFSPGSRSPVMDFSPTLTNGHSGQNDSFNSSFTRFNSMLTAGLLNPMSPPPPPQQPDKSTRSSPTLFEMMASEPEMAQPKPQIHQNG